MEALKVTITKYQVKVTNGKNNLLVTNNNINAYTKLYEALQDQEANKYILNHWGKEIACDEDKESFIKTLSKWFEN